MRLISVLLAAALGGLSAGPSLAARAPASLEEVRAERNAEKRSRLALEYAHATLDRAIATYAEGKQQAGLQLLLEIQQAAELSQESLKATGKIPSKSPKHFKRAEIETRKLLRELEAAERQVEFDHRQHVREVYDRVEEINRELLLGIMTKPKK
ncbi:MAG: hypothetical protein WD733_11405 [Bryobacterales bacterium]